MTEIETTSGYASGGPAPELIAANLFKAFDATVARLGDEIALRDPERGVELSWNALRGRVAAAAGGLARLGVGKGDTVALLHSNRHEFYVVDLAAAALGAVPFSIYPTYAAEQIAHLLADANSRVAIAETAFLERLAQERDQMPALQSIVVIDQVGSREEDGVSDLGPGGDLSLADLEQLDPGFDVAAAADGVGPDDLLTLIYTSGTTGPPKGVQLTHRNLMGLIGGIEGVIPLPATGGKVVSWLPAAHIAERGAHYYLPMMRGLSVTICPDARKIVEVLPQVRPSWFFAVPRIWEKLKAGLETMLAGLPDEQRGPAQQGVAAALEKLALEQAGEPVPEALASAVAQADEQLFSKLRARLGLDEAVAVNVGAAPTPLEVLEFFHAIGIPIGELWGMSETCGVVTANAPGRMRLGTVGPPLPGYEIKLAPDGEVLTRGTGIMTGYRNLPDKTAEAIGSDGWLATGDIGTLDPDGYLKIVDRKKELIINAAGKNMSPTEIEGKLKSASPLIGQAVAIGDRRSYNVALLVLDPEYAPAWAGKQGITDTTLAALSEDERVIAAVQDAVDAANERMARVEQIKKFCLLPGDWEAGGDELTPTMKLKRTPIAEKYAGEIDGLYAG